MAELYQGVYYSADQTRAEHELQQFLDGIEVVPLDDGICRIFAQERGRLQSEGNTIGNMDILIGSTAISHRLILLTNNRRHFERMRGINIISV